MFTVGIGTTEGAVLSVDGWSMRVRMDEASLKKVADMTRGEYFRASSAADLKSIYKYLTAKMALGKGKSPPPFSLRWACASRCSARWPRCCGPIA